MQPPIDADPYELKAHSWGQFHYIEHDSRFPDGWYYDSRVWFGPVMPKELTRYGPIPIEKLEQFVCEHESELSHTVEAVMAYLRREVK